MAPRGFYMRIRITESFCMAQSTPFETNDIVTVDDEIAMSWMKLGRAVPIEDDATPAKLRKVERATRKGIETR